MDVFFALAEPRRRRIVEIVAANGRLTATEICNNFKVTPQAVSQHLKVLLNAGVLVVEKRSQKRIYSVNPESMLEIKEWTKHLEAQWNSRFDRLDDVLKDEKGRHAKK